MRKVTTTGVLLSILVLCFGGPPTASAAETEWLCNEKVVGTKSECVVLGENLEVLLLKDMSAGSEVDCPVGSVLSEGFVGPGAKDETTKVEFLEAGAKCTAPEKAENLKGESVANACKKAVKVEAENLPWNTTLETINEELWDKIAGSKEKSNPGYLTECEVEGIKVDDLCEANEALPLLVAVEDLAADSEEPKLSLVDMLFLATTFQEKEGKEVQGEWGKCSVGGANSALVVGELLLEALLAGAAVPLKAMRKVVEGTEWLCNGEPVDSKSECVVLGENLEVLLLKDMSAGSEVDCPVGSVLSEGFVGPGAKDETTKVEFLEAGAKCTAPEKAENLKRRIGRKCMQKSGKGGS